MEDLQCHRSFLWAGCAQACAAAGHAVGPDGDRLAARPLFVRLHEEDTVKLLVALVPEDDAFVIQLSSRW
jgi:hypothetical protein